MSHEKALYLEIYSVGLQMPVRHSFIRAAAGTRYPSGTRIVNYPGDFLLPDGYPGNRIFNLM